MESDMTFTAKKEDYEMVNTVWKQLISSWVDFRDLQKMPIGERIFYLPEPTQYLYWSIVEQKKPLSTFEIKDLTKGELTPQEHLQALVTLKNMELVYETDEKIKPHYMKEIQI